MRHVMQYAGALEPNARSKKGVCGSMVDMLAAHAYGGCKYVAMDKHMLLKMWTHREVNDTPRGGHDELAVVADVPVWGHSAVEGTLMDKG